MVPYRPQWATERREIVAVLAQMLPEDWVAGLSRELVRRRSRAPSENRERSGSGGLLTASRHSPVSVGTRHAFVRFDMACR